MATVRASAAQAIGVPAGKIEELTARLTDATEAASAEIFGEEFPGGRELIVEAAIRNLANMIANNRCSTRRRRSRPTAIKSEWTLPTTPWGCGGTPNSQLRELLGPALPQARRRRVLQRLPHKPSPPVSDRISSGL